MGHCILTVDDSSTMRQMITFTLKGAGFEVLEAGDGVEALEVAKALATNPRLLYTLHTLRDPHTHLLFDAVLFGDALYC